VFASIVIVVTGKRHRPFVDRFCASGLLVGHAEAELLLAGATRRLGAGVRSADLGQDVVERLVQGLAVEDHPRHVLLGRRELLGLLGNDVHHVVRHRLVVDAGVDLGPVVLERRGALLAVVRRVALLEALDPREPLCHIGIHVLAASFDSVALAFGSTMLASESLVRILAGVSIRPQSQVKDGGHTRGGHSAGKIPGDEGLAARSK